MKSAQITRRFRAPTFALGDTKELSQDVLTFKVGGAEQGAIVQLWLHCAQARLSQVRFRAYGSPTLIAFADAFCEALDGLPIISLDGFQLNGLQQQLEVPNTEFHVVMLFNELLQNLQQGIAAARVAANNAQGALNH